MRSSVKRSTSWKPAPPTDPKSTTKLWSTVRSMSTSSSIPISTKQGRKGRKAGALGTENIEQEIPPSPPSTALEIASITESSVTARSTTRSKALTGPRNTRFKEEVLRRHGVVIDRARRPTSGPFGYFGMRQDDYTLMESLNHLNIWMNTSIGELQAIVDEYTEIMRQKLCEDEYATFAKENLLKGPRRAGYVAEDGKFRIQRLVNPSFAPEPSSHWVKLPKVNDDGVDWSWDIRADCSYWLSLRGFNEDWRSQVEDVTYIKKIVACPYFTIEFKRDGEPDDVAIKQVAAAGSIALYNRFQLYRNALRSYAFKKSTVWTPTPATEIRHFGLTFVDSTFSLWVLKPVTAEGGDRTGCTMERLRGGDCEASVHNTRVLVEWINEIHRWGVTVHGPACKDEIKMCLQRDGVRTSEIGSN
ncbi:hypothetical protein EJ04DRAFT_582610 [Polyplosphaeria fusca]|uniref:Uncharacterized protein n=1 Tax=Polyplosphaeria fusca TaxID=682080 RepID=A0A9P4QKP4_9PLEO|nr:hypothetical protein EJ04DRAFT_582610 [Polyplosphaeria fusca]